MSACLFSSISPPPYSTRSVCFGSDPLSPMQGGRTWEFCTKSPGPGKGLLILGPHVILRFLRASTDSSFYLCCSPNLLVWTQLEVFFALTPLGSTPSPAFARPRSIVGARTVLPLKPLHLSSSSAVFDPGENHPAEDGRCLRCLPSMPSTVSRQRFLPSLSWATLSICCLPPKPL